MSEHVKKILFLNLAAFSLTGGIEKFNRAFLKALSELQKKQIITALSLSAYDTICDTNYFDAKSYKCYKSNRLRFVFAAWQAASRADVIILGHINLALIAWGIKKAFPSKQIILITHGIEVWKKLNLFKNYLIHNADKILSVSNFTKNKIANIHNINPDKITVFPNTLDPFFVFPQVFKKPEYLLKRYGLKENNPIVFSLTRLHSTEKFKGYDKVINAIKILRADFSNLKYVLAGKSDLPEKRRLQELIEIKDIEDNVLLTGFIKDEEVTDHYLLADVFVLPSRKEGFGIVFIEAMACGLPVIAGNKDGSADALKNGELGSLINPEEETEILHAVKKCLDERRDWDEDAKKERQQEVINLFGFETFKNNLQKVLA